MRELFMVGTEEDDAMEDAMLRHGGAAGLELGDEVAEAINDET
jgi:hypothetical protein